MEPDYFDEHELAAMCDGASTTQTTSDQKRIQRKFLKRGLDGDQAELRPRKRKRVPSYTWLRFIDNTLSWSSGQGLCQFQYLAPLHERPDPFSWRRLALAPDQGADGVCATNMLAGPLRANVFVAWDLNHSVHNDVELSFQNSDMWTFMMTFVVVANVPCAPWGEGKRWRQARGVMDEFYRCVNPQDCPMFLSLQSALIEEFDCAAEVLSAPMPEQVLWEKVHMSSPWQWKDEKLVVNRFLGMVQRAEEEASRSASRQFAYTLACLQLDYLAGGGVRKISLPRGAGTAPETASAATSSKRVGAEEKALRSGCQNTMVLACLFWNDPLNVVRLRLVQTVTKSTLAWHKRQNHMVRNSEGARAFLLEQARGGFMAALAAVFSPMRSEDQLQHCRFVLPGGDANVERVGDAALADEVEAAKIMGSVCLSLVGARLKRMAWLFRGWPRSSALFLGSDSDQRKCGEQLMEDVASWRHCAGIAGEWKALSAIVERSCLGEVCCEQLVACYEVEGCQVTQRFKDWIYETWDTILGSQVVEDSFQRCAGMMKQGSNLRSTEKRVYKHLIESTVLEGNHRFHAVQGVSRSAHLRCPGASMGATTFTPKLREASIPDMRRIIGFEDRVKWYSPGVHTLPQKFADLEVMRCVRGGQLHPKQLKDLWLASLMKHKHNLLVRKFVDGEYCGEWCFALQDVADSVALVWPAQEVRPFGEGGEVFFEPADTTIA